MSLMAELVVLLVSVAQDVPVGDLGLGGLVLALIWMLFAGRIVTRREADAKDRQIDYLQRANDEKDRTIAAFKEVTATNNSLLQSVIEMARRGDDR